MNTTWNIHTPSEQESRECRRLADELKISTLSALLLIRRGLTTPEQARAFVRPSLQQLYDPFLMKDMDLAVQRLQRALDDHENILIYGDYDVDGTTAVALLYTFLHPRTDHLGYYIPDRYKEGYGISTQGIDYAHEHGYTLVIALDCGIKAVDKVEYAAGLGIDFIICDHHTPGDTLPAAAAVLNMKRHDCPYPYKELSGCGVGFKLAQAWLRHTHSDEGELLPLLPLLALSIACDIVPVTDENRILAYFGVRQLNLQPSVGIQALLHMAGIDNGPVTLSDLGYRIGPRVNACGRMKSGAEAVQLLITQDQQRAAQLAQDIETYNRSRREADIRITDEARLMLEADPDNDTRTTTVVYNPDWHKGVVGIAASRLIESFYRPTIVLTAGEDDIISGSARSVAGFDIYTAIDSCRDLLTNFGGHTFAAGLSLHLQNLPEFRRRFEQYVAEHITPRQKQPVLHIEADIRLSDITAQFFNILRHLEPFGPQNANPVFLTRRLTNYRNTKRVGKQGEHLRVELTDGTNTITGIAFGFGDRAEQLRAGVPMDFCYRLTTNTFNGKTEVQMYVLDIQPSEAQP